MSEPNVPAASGASAQRETILSIVHRLKQAQKPAARSAPAYSRFVNRRIGRYLAAWAHSVGLGPNAVTAISAIWTFGGIALLMLFPPSWGLGIVVTLCLLIGYAFDSADGQVSRLQGSSSPAGEWLDHMVDSVKVSTMPLALAIGFYRFDVSPRGWLLVPIAFTIVSAVLFFCMILTEQLRRAHGTASRATDAPGRPSWIRAVLVLPMDYGILCVSFVLLGAPIAFMVVYTLLFVATTLFLLGAVVKWFRELRAWPLPGQGENGSPQ
ncbi:MAG: CDP-alcohol phosphatidyltransferase family protein [Lacisediminihabitans sp.]